MAEKLYKKLIVVDSKNNTQKEVAIGQVDPTVAECLQVSSGNNIEIVAPAGRKLNLCAQDEAIQIKPGSQEYGENEPIQLDCELGNKMNGENVEIASKEVGIKVCNGALPKANRVVGMKLNTAEIIIDTQRADVDFDHEAIDIKYRYDKKDHPIYAKHKARAFDFRCQDHGGIALQIAGQDSDNHENKIKFESSRQSNINDAAAYGAEGGEGLEFGTFNNLHTSLYTGDYRFKADAPVYAVSRGTLETTYESDGVTVKKIDYPTQADDFKDIINSNTKNATWNEIVNVARQYADGNVTVDLSNYYTKSDVDSKIADINIEGAGVDPEELQEMVNNKVTELIQPKNAYDSIKKINNFLYEVDYSNLDYTKAEDYFLNNFNDITGGCSAIRNGNFFGRNYDWFYDNSVSFVVRTPREKNRLASLSVSSGITSLTASLVESREYSNIYEILPFFALDGINEAGVFVNDNVVPKAEAGSGIPTTGTNPDASTSLCMLMIPRFVLDNCSSASDAIEKLRNINIWAPTSATLEHYELHFIIGDASSTYIIEFIDNELVVVDFDAETAIKNKPFMTNFFVSPLTDSDFVDGKLDRMGTGLTPFGAGVERYNIIIDEYSNANTKDGMIQLMKDLKYTKMYDETVDPAWLTELVGSHVAAGSDQYVMINSPAEDFEYASTVSKQRFANRLRGNYETWQTVHSSTYDIENRSLTIFVQEDFDNAYEFNFKQYYNSVDIDNKLIEVDNKIANSQNPAVDFLETRVFRKEKNGNLEVTAEGLGKYAVEGDPSTEEVSDPASLDLVSDGKIAFKCEELAFEGTTLGIPLSINKNGKVEAPGVAETGKAKNLTATNLTPLENNINTVLNAFNFDIALVIENGFGQSDSDYAGNTEVIDAVNAAYPDGSKILSVNVFDLLKRVSTLETTITTLESTISSLNDRLESIEAPDIPEESPEEEPGNEPEVEPES